MTTHDTTEHRPRDIDVAPPQPARSGRIGLAVAGVALATVTFAGGYVVGHATAGSSSGTGQTGPGGFGGRGPQNGPGIQGPAATTT